MAELLGVNPHDVETIRLGAILHDVGKIGIPDRVLLKPGPLDEEERRIVETHPEIGDKLPKSGLLLAILDPSAGIAFGYEGWSVRTSDGQQLIGMITSETDDEVVGRDDGQVHTGAWRGSALDAVARTFPKPLERTMTEADLTNLTEYLSSLHKAR